MSVVKFSKCTHFGTVRKLKYCYRQNPAAHDLPSRFLFCLNLIFCQRLMYGAQGKPIGSNFLCKTDQDHYTAMMIKCKKLITIRLFGGNGVGSVVHVCAG